MNVRGWSPFLVLVALVIFVICAVLCLVASSVTLPTILGLSFIGFALWAASLLIP